MLVMHRNFKWSRVTYLQTQKQHKCRAKKSLAGVVSQIYIQTVVIFKFFFLDRSWFVWFVIKNIVKRHSRTDKFCNFVIFLTLAILRNVWFVAKTMRTLDLFSNKFSVFFRISQTFSGNKNWIFYCLIQNWHYALRISLRIEFHP